MGVYFEKAGRENTGAALKVAKEEALRPGDPADCGRLHAGWYRRGDARHAGTGIQLVVVSHNVGFRETGQAEFEAEKKRPREAFSFSGADAL